MFSLPNGKRPRLQALFSHMLPCRAKHSFPACAMSMWCACPSRFMIVLEGNGHAGQHAHIRQNGPSAMARIDARPQRPAPEPRVSFEECVHICSSARRDVARTFAAATSLAENSFAARPALIWAHTHRTDHAVISDRPASAQNGRDEEIAVLLLRSVRTAPLPA